MAKRRMFSLDIVNTDSFYEMPSSTQNLYFQLGMHADDDGFVASPRTVTRLARSTAKDYSRLVSNGYIIPFDSGVCVIRDWKINNYIQSDRYTPSRHKAEKQLLTAAANMPYELRDTPCIQNVSETDTQVRLGKVSIVKDSKDKESIGKDSKDKESKDKESKAQYRDKGVMNNNFGRTDNRNGVSQWNISYDIDGTKI